MKNRRTTLIVFVLIAALCVGIGYAALSDTLTVSGTAHYGQNELDQAVYFSAATNNGSTLVNPGNHILANNATIAPVTGTSFVSKNVDELVISVPVDNLFDPGDSITFTADITYDPAVISSTPDSVIVDAVATVVDDHDAFDVTCVWDAGDDGVFTNTKTVQTIVITITLNDNIYALPSATCNFTITHGVRLGS